MEIKYTFGIIMFILPYFIAPILYLNDKSNFFFELQILCGIYYGGLIICSLYLRKTKKNSIYYFIHNKKIKEILGIFLISGLVGILYEFIGQKIFSYWYYPLININYLLNFLLFFAWGMFGIVIRELFLYFEDKKINLFLNSIYVTLFLLISMELMNIFTRSWIYSIPNWFLFFFGWYSFVWTFYIIPKYLLIIK